MRIMQKSTQEEGRVSITRDRIEQIVNECIDELIQNDLCLLQNDVSERAITHKIAVYLQDRIPNLNVDCEYNRNFELGRFVSKRLAIPKFNGKKTIRTYPDIIAHHRMTNDENLLVIEVKKGNSKVSHDLDQEKLRAFTDKSNNYNFMYGVFILIYTGKRKRKDPELTWFVEGEISSSYTLELGCQRNRK